MKNFLNRIGIVIHWSGFIYFLFLLVVVGSSLFVETGFPWWTKFIVVIPFGVSFWIGGWVLRYIVSGNKNIFPWK